MSTVDTCTDCMFCGCNYLAFFNMDSVVKQHCSCSSDLANHGLDQHSACKHSCSPAKLQNTPQGNLSPSQKSKSCRQKVPPTSVHHPCWNSERYHCSICGGKQSSPKSPSLSYTHSTEFLQCLHASFSAALEEAHRLHLDSLFHSSKVARLAHA